MCNNRLFNKVFLFSISFLFISAITHVVFSAHTKTAGACETTPVKAKIQVQQREIMTRLKGVERKILVKKEN